MKWDDIQPSSPSQKGGVMKWDDIQPTNAGVGSSISEGINDVPRQLGLTARHIIEGVGDTADMVAYPVRYGLNKMGANIEGRTGQAVSDLMNLPKPQGSTERVVGDISRLASGSAGIVGAASKLANATTGTTKAIFNALASRPDLQLTSAVGAGGAGGYVRETGGDETAQAVAALAGGVAAPVAAAGVQSAVSGVKNAADRLVGSPQFNAKIDGIIDNAVRQSGHTLEDLPKSVLASLRQDMQKFANGGELSPDVMRRLVDYRLTGLTPTAGPLTLDPGIVTRQKNLANIGINSQDESLQQLAQIENANSRKLIDNLNSLGASTADDSLTAGQKVMDVLKSKDAAQKTEWSNAYQQAEKAAGINTPLPKTSTDIFWKKAIPIMDSMKSVLPREVKDRMVQYGAFGKQTRDLTVGETNDFIKLINQHYDPANAPQRFALDSLRTAMKEATDELASGTGTAAQMFAKGRDTMSSWMRVVDETPALQAVRDGMDPDKFTQRFIIGTGKDASVNANIKLVNLIKDSPESMVAVKNNIAQALKKAALSGKPDEIGRFSSSGYGRLLSSIGDMKLKLYFSPEEVTALRAIGRVSGYEQFQPPGSAVNNSKTAATMIATILDKIGNNPIAKTMTVGASGPTMHAISGSIRNYGMANEAANMTKIPANILTKSPKDPIFMLPPVLAPWLLTEQQ